MNIKVLQNVVYTSCKTKMVASNPQLFAQDFHTFIEQNKDNNNITELTKSLALYCQKIKYLELVKNQFKGLKYDNELYDKINTAVAKISNSNLKKLTAAQVYILTQIKETGIIPTKGGLSMDIENSIDPRTFLSSFNALKTVDDYIIEKCLMFIQVNNFTLLYNNLLNNEDEEPLLLFTKIYDVINSKDLQDEAQQISISDALNAFAKSQDDKQLYDNAITLFDDELLFEYKENVKTILNKLKSQEIEINFNKKKFTSIDSLMTYLANTDLSGIEQEQLETVQKTLYNALNNVIKEQPVTLHFPKEIEQLQPNEVLNYMVNHRVNYSLNDIIDFVFNNETLDVLKSTKFDNGDSWLYGLYVDFETIFNRVVNNSSSKYKLVDNDGFWKAGQTLVASQKQEQDFIEFGKTAFNMSNYDDIMKTLFTLFSDVSDTTDENDTEKMRCSLLLLYITICKTDEILNDGSNNTMESLIYFRDINYLLEAESNNVINVDIKDNYQKIHNEYEKTKEYTHNNKLTFKTYIVTLWNNDQVYNSQQTNNNSSYNQTVTGNNNVVYSTEQNQDTVQLIMDQTNKVEKEIENMVKPSLQNKVNDYDSTSEAYVTVNNQSMTLEQYNFLYN